MALRYYLCDLIGTGDPDTDLYRPACADYPGVDYSAHYGVQDPETGEYAVTQVLCLVAARDHTPLEKDSRIIPLPDLGLDAKLDTLPARDVTTLKETLATKGYRTDFPATLTQREVLALVAADIGPGFDVRQLAVSEGA